MTLATDELLTGATVHRAELVTYARRELGPWADAAEDIVQDAYLHLVGRAEAGEAPHSPRAWLHAVVRSRCADERRRRSRERPSDLTETPTPAPGPHELAAGAAESRWALAQIAELPANERDAIVAQVAGASAAYAGSGRRSANAVYQSLHRARARLRQAREAAWAALFPFPIRLWMARATPAVRPEAVPGGGRMAGAAVVACISVAGVVGGAQVARVAYSAPDPTPVARATSRSVASAPRGARIGVAAAARGIPVTVAPGGPPAQTVPDSGPTPAKPVSGAPDAGSGTQDEAAFADSPAAVPSDSPTNSATSDTPTDQPAEASPSSAPADQPAPADTGTTTEATDPLAAPADQPAPADTGTTTEATDPLAP